MSQERRERQKEKLGRPTAAGRKWRRIAIYAVATLVLVGLAYYLYNHSQHRHDAFARCLTERGVKMYGAWWCPHCAEQKELFGASFEFAPYVECGIKGDTHGRSKACEDANIKRYPTWQFPPTGERVEHIFSLGELRERTGCPLP